MGDGGVGKQPAVQGLSQILCQRFICLVLVVFGHSVSKQDGKMIQCVLPVLDRASPTLGSFADLFATIALLVAARFYSLGSRKYAVGLGFVIDVMMLLATRKSENSFDHDGTSLLRPQSLSAESDRTLVR